MEDYQEYIFISHSRRDKVLVEFFEKAIKKIGLGVVLIEQENWDWVNVNQVITEGIRHGCVGLAVLLGRNVHCPPEDNRLHTHNWISFEIGVAAGSSKPGGKPESTKPVIVFEDYEDDIYFPVPFLTDYIRYSQSEIHSHKIGEALKKILSNEMIMAPDGIQCRNPKCNAIYRFWSDRSILPCPVCRKKFDYGEPITRYNPLRFSRNEA
jgi:hypothetical protein